MFNILLKLFISFTLALSGSVVAVAANTDTLYELIIVKSKRMLVVKKGPQLIKKYHVAIGQGGAGKKRVVGDKHTPEGEYEVVDYRPSRKFHYFMQLNYPSRRDAMAGFKNGLISWEELVRIYRAHQEKNGIPPQQTQLGGFIGIHGIGKETQQKLAIHRDFDWTQGCIALTNTEIDELRQFIRRGTRVTILNKPSDKEIFSDIDVASSVSLSD